MDLLVHLLLGIAVLSGGSDRLGVQDDPWIRITIELEIDGTGHTTFHVDDPTLLPDTLRTIGEAEQGVEEIEGGALALHFAGRPLDRMLPELLAHLPADRSGVSVLVRVPPDLQGGDLWEFQAQLSSARIRRVRITREDPRRSELRRQTAVRTGDGVSRPGTDSSIQYALPPLSEVP